jgi:dienelactone hydrolase
MPMKKFILQIILLLLIFSPENVQADVPKISNLQFSDNPITLGEWITISFEFEGRVEKYRVENVWETKDGEVKKEGKEFPVKPEIKEKPAGLITLRWQWNNPAPKPYRIVKVWALDAAGNQSNVLSGEVKVAKGIVMGEEEVKIPLELKYAFTKKTINLSGTIYKPDSAEKFPLVILNHGTPRNAEDRKKTMKFKEQSKVFVKKGFVVAAPIRRGHGTSEGEYAEHSGKCNESDYFHGADEAVKDIKATHDFMKKKPYIDTDKKILLVGQSAGGFSSLAYASVYPDEVVAVINFAGGKGSTGPYNVCSPDRLVLTVGNFGKTSKKLPTIWIYTEKDDFFPPDLSKKMFAAYKKSGGEGKFLMLQSEFGHSFFHKAEAIKTWEPIVEEFLKEINVLK